MPSFQRTVCVMSSVGSFTRMPMGDVPAACMRACSKSCAAWISAFEGMQPMFRHVPPRLAPSASTVGTPSCPARMAAT